MAFKIDLPMADVKDANKEREFLDKADKDDVTRASAAVGGFFTFRTEVSSDHHVVVSEKSFRGVPAKNSTAFPVKVHDDINAFLEAQGVGKTVAATALIEYAIEQLKASGQKLVIVEVKK